MKFAQRRSLIDSSGIRKVFDLAAKMKDPINLSIGMPDFDVPEAVKEACIAAVRGGRNAYTQTMGIPALRKAIGAHYEEAGIPHEDVLVTSGTSGGLFLLFLVLLDPGDEVLIADPYFVMYKHLIRFLGGTPVPVDTYPTFRWPIEQLDKYVTPRTKLMIVNSPSNPTGVVYTEAECKALAEFCDKRGIVLLSDEIYDKFCFDGEFPSPAKFAKEPVVISGLSKSVGMTGWRVGWTAGPKDLIKAMTEVQQYTFVCAPSIAQEASIAALAHDSRAINDDYRKRRDAIYAALSGAGYNVQKPGGAFYIFPEAPGGDGDAFVARAIENKLLIIPGSVFSERKSHFRVSFAAPLEKIARAAEVFAKLRG